MRTAAEAMTKGLNSFKTAKRVDHRKGTSRAKTLYVKLASSRCSYTRVTTTCPAKKNSAKKEVYGKREEGEEEEEESRAPTVAAVLVPCHRYCFPLRPLRPCRSRPRSRRPNQKFSATTPPATPPSRKPEHTPGYLW